MLSNFKFSQNVFEVARCTRFLY